MRLRFLSIIPRDILYSTTERKNAACVQLTNTAIVFDQWHRDDSMNRPMADRYRYRIQMYHSLVTGESRTDYRSLPSNWSPNSDRFQSRLSCYSASVRLWRYSLLTLTSGRYPRGSHSGSIAGVVTLLPGVTWFEAMTQWSIEGVDRWSFNETLNQLACYLAQSVYCHGNDLAGNSWSKFIKGYRVVTMFYLEQGSSLCFLQ